MDSGAWAAGVVEDAWGRADIGMGVDGTSEGADGVSCEEREGASVVTEAEEGVRSWF
jgi:hypothetical protein